MIPLTFDEAPGPSWTDVFGCCFFLCVWFAAAKLFGPAGQSIYYTSAISVLMPGWQIKRKHQNGSCPYVEWLIWPVILICSLRLSLSPSIIYPAGHFELKGARFWNNSSGLVGASLSAVISWQEFFHHCHFLFSSKAKNSSENSIGNDDTKTGTLLVSWKGNWRPCQREKASSVWVRLVDPKVSKLFTIFIWFLFFFSRIIHTNFICTAESASILVYLFIHAIYIGYNAWRIWAFGLYLVRI